MANFEDPSIISLVPSGGQTSKFFGSSASGPVGEDNAIMKFLREGEKKKEQEEQQEQKKEAVADITKILSNAESNRDKEEIQESTKYITPEHIKSRTFNIEDGNHSFTNTNVTRYTPTELLRIRESPLVPSADELDLPDQEYYRLKNKLPLHIKREWNNNSTGNNYNGSSRNYDNTGAMGNFNLNKYGRGLNDRNRGQRKNNRGKRNDGLEWLNEFDRDAPAAGSADDFEKYRARVQNEEKRKRGEPILEASNSSTSTLAKDGGDNVDSFFGMGSKSSLNASAAGVDAKNSRFFSMFNQSEPTETKSVDDTPAEDTKDGVSKILSFLDRGERAAASTESNSPQLPPQQSQSVPPQQRSQFFQSESGSPAVTPVSQLPPGLNQQSGNQDFFFMSLMNKKPEEGKESATSAESIQQRSSAPHTPQSNPVNPPKVPSQSQLQQAQAPKQQQQAGPQPTSQLQPQQLQQQQQQLAKEAKPPTGQNPPPGFQGIPGGPVNHSQFEVPLGLQPGQIPPQFNGQRVAPGPGQMLPPGINPQQLPPWMNGQQLPPNLRQFPPQGRFMAPPPPPNGFVPQNGFPPQMRPPQGIPPQMIYQGIPPQHGQQGMPHVFADGRNAPPGFYGGPPPGFPMQPYQQGQQHGQQQQQQQQQQHQQKNN